MKLAIYSRGNTHIEIDPEMQVKACLEYAEKNGHSVVAAYGDLTEGEATDFPAFSWLLKKSKRNRFKTILVYSPRCFAETMVDFLMQREALYRKGVNVHFVEDTPNFPGNVNIDELWCAYREFMRDFHSNRIKRGIRLAKERKTAVHVSQQTNEINLKK